MATNPLFTADEARALKPKADLRVVCARVSMIIRQAAPTRGFCDLPMDLLPPGEMASWATGIGKTPAARALTDLLEGAGYQIDTNSGGHHGHGYVRIVWGR